MGLGVCPPPCKQQPHFSGESPRLGCSTPCLPKNAPSTPAAPPASPKTPPAAAPLAPPRSSECPHGQRSAAQARLSDGEQVTFSSVQRGGKRKGEKNKKIKKIDLQAVL